MVDNGYQTADDHTETSVRIKRLGRQHLGKYICRAQNKLGTKEKVIIDLMDVIILDFLKMFA